MAARYLNIIKEFSESELRTLFEKNNNLTLYEELVNKADSLDGSTFLNLTEFQIVRWKLSTPHKQQLLKFLDEIKQNPQKFINNESTKSDNTKLNRRDSVYKHDNIKKQLEQVILNPYLKSSARNELNPSPVPPPSTQLHENEYSNEEYLEMDQNNEKSIDPYYDDGYLKPTEAVKLLKRAPQALPRESTDGGYIQGPQPFDYVNKTPELPPRLRLNVSQSEDSEGEIYEPVEDDERFPNLSRTNFSRSAPDITNNVLTYSYNNPPKNSSEGAKNSRPLPPLPTSPMDKLNVMMETTDIYENTVENKNTILRGKSEIMKSSEGVRGYQMHMPSKINLPLPPRTIPQLNQEEFEIEEEEDGPYGNCTYNVNNEPFYRKTDRKGAKQLLDAFGEGAFLFRPSLEYSFSLSLKHKGQIFHLGIDRVDKKFRLNAEGGEGSPEFSTLSGLVDYFSKECITFKYKGEIIKVVLQRHLPPHVF